MTSPSPTDPTCRIAAIDALRGIALCGILLVNIFDMGGPIAMDRPITVPSIADPDWQVWAAAQLFITGTMRGLFSMLFGIGLLLFLRDDGDPARIGLYLRRMLFLLLFGIADSTLLLWPGDILIIYALAGLVLLALQPLGSIQLLSIAGVALLLLSGWAGIEAHGLDPLATIYSPAALARETAVRMGDYAQNLAYMSHVSWIWTINILTWRWVMDGAAFMLIGMMLYREGLFGPDADRRLLIRLAGWGYAVGLALRTLHMLLIWNHDGGPTVLSAVIDQPGRLAMTLGHVGLFLLVWRGAGQGLLARFGKMGRMALTLYLGQSLMAALIFPGFGLGLWNSLSWPQLLLVALAMLAVEALFARLWFARFRYGPLEYIWRWGTYGRRP